jgi:protein phosphatase
MSSRLKVSVGQYADKGRKASNQDFHGCYLPTEPLLSRKGVAFAMADGISSSELSHIASETAVKNFLDDYFCTSDAWSVQHSVERVVTACNAWLHSQTMSSPYRFDKDRGYVCTLSALVFKATRAHIFNVGDTRIYRLHDKGLEQLTHDHRLWVSQTQSHLSRALGVEAQIELDYQSRPLRQGDIYLLATDGVYEYADTSFVLNSIANSNDLDTAARRIVEHALEQGSGDNLSLQIVRIDALPNPGSASLHRDAEALELPPILAAGARFDGYKILRELHATSRSHVYLALDEATNSRVVLKTPSIDLGGDPAYLERFLMEEWTARRINSTHVLKAAPQSRPRQYLYTAMEFIEGQTLKQWLVDNPRPGLETVRGIVEQVARGLQALHRMEILHQDLKPDNIMIDNSGTVKIIDFGAARVAGIVESEPDVEQDAILGTALYTAPEYFMGEVGTSCSDLYSLGVLSYHMLSGDFPYGTEVSKCRTTAAQRRLHYGSVLHDEREIPAWIDETLKKAVHINPYKRYQELSEFMADLRQPNRQFLNRARPPLLERNPVRFWQGVAAILAGIIVVLLQR